MPVANVMIRETSTKRNVLKGEDIKLGPRTIDFSIADVREVKKDKDKPFLIFEVSYVVKYTLEKPKDTNIGEILVVGEVFYIDEPNKVKELLDVWKKDKKLNSEVMKEVMNAALRKFQVEAIAQSDKVGLPTPIPLPSLSEPKPKKEGNSSAA